MFYIKIDTTKVYLIYIENFTLKLRMFCVFLNTTNNLTNFVWTITKQETLEVYFIILLLNTYCENKKFYRDKVYCLKF